MSIRKGPKRLRIINPGYDREGIDSPSGPSTPIHIFLQPTPQGRLEDNVWPALQWWESPLQAEAGIKALCDRPFLHLTKDGRQATVSAQQLYPDALDPTDDDRIKAASQSIAANVRQGRELYMAAGSSGVTDLSTPLLYYYGALALAKAAISSVFGTWSETGERHGLGHNPNDKPTAKHPCGIGWPTIIVWQKSGVFHRFYRATRYDEVWQNWAKLGLPANPQFHVLECIRYLGSEWGILPSTGFVPIGFPPPPEPEARLHPRQKYLLAYLSGGNLFMQLATSPASPVFQLPRVIVQFMLLHYFSTLARYHVASWQELLGGATEPEGYVFRSGFQQIAGEFIREITHMLPRPNDVTLPIPSAPLLPTPLPAGWLTDWYTWAEEPSTYPLTT